MRDPGKVRTGPAGRTCLAIASEGGTGPGCEHGAKIWERPSKGLRVRVRVIRCGRGVWREGRTPKMSIMELKRLPTKTHPSP